MTSNFTYVALILGVASLMFIHINFFLLLLILIIVLGVLNSSITTAYLFLFSPSLKKIKYSKSKNSFYTHIRTNENDEVMIQLLVSKTMCFDVVYTGSARILSDESYLNKQIMKHIDYYDQNEKVKNVSNNKRKNIKDKYKNWDGILTKQDKRNDTINKIVD